MECNSSEISIRYSYLRLYRSRFLVRGEGRELQRVNPLRQLLGKQRVDRALALEPALAGERSGYDLDTEMRLAALARAGVAAMAVRVVDDIKPRRRETGELVADAIAHRHLTSVAPPRQAVKGCRADPRALSGFGATPILSPMVRERLEHQEGPATAAAMRLCDHPGCASAGDYRAPRSRAALHLFYWFCLDHVRAYNAAWNYYAGMSAAELEREIRNDTVWQRPTWPMGTRTGAGYTPRFRDYGMFGLEDEGPDRGDAVRRRPKSQQEQALAIFNLVPPLTLAGLKSRYKELVKLHHPDVHGGDRAAEERLKIINLAYATLKASYFP